MPTPETATALASKILGDTADDAVLKMLLGGAKRQAAGEAEPEDDPLDTDPTDGEDDDEDVGDPSETSTDQSLQEAEEGEGDDGSADDTDGDVEDGYETVVYNDDDLVSVIVDGEEKEVSLKDLKRQYSGEGAIEKRLQEATELRKTAAAEREAVKTEIEANRVDLLNSIAALDKVLFAPLVPPPDPRLRQTNPNQYLAHQDAYMEDQRRIQQSQQQVVQLFTQERDRKVKDVAAYREQQTKMLLAQEPTLVDPKVAAAFRDDLDFMAKHYGFSANDLATVDNHAMLLVARDAGRYQKLMQGKKSGTVPTNGDGKVIKRRLKAGSPTASAKPSSKDDKAYAKAQAQARKTGSVDDVANLLLANATRGKQQPSRRR